ncbi:pentapeptide repeat-containing protein [Glycomyces sp. NRRL B-16210]|uniref:pentapeptide repeat-containing protein n=1 Tax=Glycomyces sp. NRRL B-16210 TaxID=1463821 RepID=UPI001061D262|nr:pentapeptide repeat-containing protein [Glycomyces sp. NRRL B-16210]
MAENLTRKSHNETRERSTIWRSPEFWGTIALWTTLAVAATVGMYFWLMADIAALDHSNPAERVDSVIQGVQAKHVAVLAGLGSATIGVLLLRFRKQLHDERESERAHKARERQLANAERQLEHSERQLALRDEEMRDARLDSERQLALRDEEMRNTRADAEQRRILDHWARAIDKLGSESSMVRIAGLHLLEELARQYEDKRQAIIDHICAYLRQHYQPPQHEATGWPGVSGPLPDLFGPLPPAPNHEVDQERQVRLEAQRILQRHLNRVEHAEEYWEHDRIILAGAFLENIIFDDCELHGADFSSAVFVDFAEFSHAKFPTGATFRAARFESTANFIEAEFDCDLEYLARRKPGQVQFSEQFCADFRDTIFRGDSEWTVTKFHADVTFSNARFSKCGFSAASFNKSAFFQNVTFDDMLFFDVRRCYMAHFNGAKATSKQPHQLHDAMMLELDPNSNFYRMSWSLDLAYHSTDNETRPPRQD